MHSIGIRARNSNWAAFFVMGICSMAWIPRIPEIKEQLGMHDGQFGFIFLSGGTGAVIGTFLSGRAIHKMSSRTFAGICALFMCSGVFIMGSSTNVPLLAIGLFISGLGYASMDVSINVQAMAIEKITKARYMSSFHAWWSIGAITVTFFGGLLATHLTPQAHLKMMALISLVAYGLAIPGLLPGYLDGHKGEPHEDVVVKLPLFSRQTIPLWALGFGLMASFMPEAGIYDWSGILLKEHMNIGKGVTASAATAFSIGMIVSRLIGDRWFEKWGHRKTVQYGGYISGVALAISLGVGVPLSSVNKWAGLTLFCIGLIICGLAIGPFFPAFNLAAMSVPGIPPSIGMSRVSLIAIGTNFFGPAIIGGVSQLTTLPISFALLAALLFVVGRQSRYIAVKDIK